MPLSQQYMRYIYRLFETEISFPVENFHIIIRYARLWMMPGLVALCEHFVEKKLLKMKPNLQTTIGMLEGACRAQYDNNVY